MRQPSDADALIVAKSVEGRGTMTEAEAARLLIGCMVQDVYRFGKKAGIVVVKGPEVHLCVLPTFRNRCLTKGLMVDVLGRIIREYGYALTRVVDGNAIGDRFVKRIGFRPIEKVGNAILYKLES